MLAVQCTELCVKLLQLHRVEVARVSRVPAMCDVEKESSDHSCKVVIQKKVLGKLLFFYCDFVMHDNSTCQRTRICSMYDYDSGETREL